MKILIRFEFFSGTMWELIKAGDKYSINQLSFWPGNITGT